MATKPVKTTEPASEKNTVEAVTLDEFCTRLSTRDKRVELIGGFHFTETKANHAKDLEANYQARFDAFVNKPV